jgi:glucose-6-phosphate-specific signal transduction histidine kinase
MAMVAHSRPQLAPWVGLIYVLPTVWCAVHFGLRGGMLAASASGLLLLAGAGVMEFAYPVVGSDRHGTVFFAGLVLLSVLGAVTGAFQEGRERMAADLEMAEERLRRASRLSRHDR